MDTKMAAKEQWQTHLTAAPCVLAGDHSIAMIDRVGGGVPAPVAQTLAAAPNRRPRRRPPRLSESGQTPYLTNHRLHIHTVGTRLK